MFIISQLLLCDLSSFTHSAIFSNLFQGQKVRAGIHNSSGHNDGRNIDSPHTHKMGRHSLIAACNKHPAVKRRSICMNFNHIGDHIPGCQRVIDAVVSLGFSVTDISGKISGSVSSGLSHPFSGLFHQFQQMSAAWMTISKSALDHNLGF